MTHGPSEGSLVGYEYADGVAWVQLCDPGRGNPIHAESVRQLTNAVRRAHTDAARVIVLAAEGRFFSVGGDLREFASATDVSVYLDDLVQSLNRVLLELMRSPAVVVSVVQGPAAGGGFPLAAAADVVVAARSASFSLGYTRVGLTPDAGATLLVHTLGLHRALRMALLNDALTAEEAQQAGLVARVVDDDDLDTMVGELVQRLAKGPSGAQGATKALLRQAAEAAPERALQAEVVSIRAAAATGDGREGVAAFLDRRRPVFVER